MKHLMGIDQFFLLCCLAAFFHVSSCNGAALNKSPYGRAFLTKLAKFRKSLDPAHQDAVHPLITRAKSIRRESRLAKWIPVECKVLKIFPEVVQVIHEGRNVVKHVVDPATQVHYIHKIFEKSDEYTNELTLSIFVDHPFIAKAVCFMAEKKSKRAGLLMEYVHGSTSKNYAKNASYLDIVRMSRQLLEALAHLHAIGYVHADLKPDNVLVDASGNVKLIDFGFGIASPYSKTARGTHSTMAPELVEAVHGAIHEGIDWWAYGSTVAIWHGINCGHRKNTKFIPFYVEDKHEDYELEERYWFGEVPAEFPTALRQFLCLFFTPSPDDRRFNTKSQLDFLRALPYFNNSQ